MHKTAIRSADADRMAVFNFYIRHTETVSSFV